MSTPLLLIAIAALVGGLSGHPLSRARWTRRAPRLAVAFWHALCFGVLSSIVLGGAALVLPLLPLVLTGGLSDFLARCALVLQGESAAPRSLAVGLAGFVAAVATFGRFSWAAARGTRETRRVRRAQLDSLALLGSKLTGGYGENVVLLVDARPAAYCLPSRGRGTIVVSTGSLDLLEDDQLRLVLAHERAHLRQRHHAVTRLSAALCAAFSWVPLFRLAASEVPLLLEMAADDEAIRATETCDATRLAVARGGARRRLGHALVTLATAQSASPVGALAAVGGSAVARVHRLVEPPLPLGSARVGLLGVGVVLSFAGPTLLASAPALCATVMEICPLFS